MLAELERVLRVEINAATDNPLVFATGRGVSGGNFHGEPLALALDYATMAVAELASIVGAAHGAAGGSASERRPAGVPHRGAGHGSGLMIAHYTAAALVNELQGLSHPASVDTIPTSANQEDHVSMGGTSALQLAAAVDRAEQVLAIEALCAAQGLDFREPMKPGVGVATAHAAIRARRAALGRGSAAVPRHRDPARAASTTATCSPTRPPPVPTRPMPDLEFALVDEASVRRHPGAGPPGDAGARPATTGSGSTGTREAPAADARDATTRTNLKRSRLLASRDVAGSYAHGRVSARCGRADRRRVRAVRPVERVPARPGRSATAIPICPSLPRRGS